MPSVYQQTSFDERTIQIPEFLFFSWTRDNRSDCGKQFIPKHDSTTTQVYTGARCDTNAHLTSSVTQNRVRLVSLQMRE
jgi:hypothetical protein